jgi:NAD+ synthase (glutamine-hydrolysing)
MIPPHIITKEPSAELRENQKDTDDIPSYDILDPILKAYITENKSRQKIIKQGYDKKIINDIIRRVDHNEYKRKQTAIGIKITPRAFGFGRRMPIVNKYF